MRRLILEEPWSAAALWSRRLALFALTVGLMSVGLARSGLIEVSAVLAVFGAAVIIACLGLLLGGAGSVVIWRTGRRGVGSIVGAALLAGLLLAYPAWLVAQAIRLPALNDISTDLNDPPEFARSSRALAARDAMSHEPIAQQAREAQKRAYPGVAPIILDLDADEAWQIVQKAIAAHKWLIVDQVTPGGRVGVGHIDAVDKTLNEHSKLVQDIYKNPEVPPDEKRQLIDQLYSSMIAVARSGNEAIRTMQGAIVQKNMLPAGPGQ